MLRVSAPGVQDTTIIDVIRWQNDCVADFVNLVDHELFSPIDDEVLKHEWVLVAEELCEYSPVLHIDAVALAITLCRMAAQRCLFNVAQLRHASKENLKV